MGLLKPLKAFRKWRGDRSEIRRKITEAQERLAIHPGLGTIKDIPVKGFRKAGYYKARLADLKDLGEVRERMNTRLAEVSKHLSKFIPNAAGSPVHSHQLSLHATIAYQIGKHPWQGPEEFFPFVTIHEGKKRIGSGELKWDKEKITVRLVGKKAQQQLGASEAEIPLTHAFRQVAVNYHHAERTYSALKDEYYKKYANWGK